MHFFNPPPLMRLLEVVAGEQSSQQALALAHATGEAMGKKVIRAKDGPGFLVNRCNRPFGLEALRLLQERIADIETIDRIVRMEGGFRMGPFELMDLVGVDGVWRYRGASTSRASASRAGALPRSPPATSPRGAAAARARGYYDYSGVASLPPPRGRQITDRSRIGESVVSAELSTAARRAGRWPAEELGGEDPSAALTAEAGASRTARTEWRVRGPLCDVGSLAGSTPAASVGFHLLPPLAAGSPS